MSVEMISAIATGLTSILGAVAVLLANRSRRAGSDYRVYRTQARLAQRKLLAALSHLFVLETELAERGIPIPARPAVLDADEDEPETAAPTHRGHG